MQRLIDNLRSLAEAATPGPWEHDVDRFSNEEGIVAVITNVRQGASIKDDMLVKIETGLLAHTDEAWKRACESQERRDAAYIAAASPDRIIALLDALDEADSKLRGTVAMRDLAIKRGNDFADGLLVASAERDSLAQQLEAMRKELDEARDFLVEYRGVRSQHGAAIRERDAATIAPSALRESEERWMQQAQRAAGDAADLRVITPPATGAASKEGK